MTLPFFQENHMDQGGRKKLKNVLQPVPVRRFDFAVETMQSRDAVLNNWQFLNLVVLNLVVCNFYAEALFGTLLRPLRSFADLHLRSFALFCSHLRVYASDRVQSDRISILIWELQKQIKFSMRNEIFDRE